MKLDQWLNKNGISQVEFCKLVTQDTPENPLKQPSLNEWLQKGSCPPRRAQQVERLTNGEVKIHEACPRYFNE